MSKTIHIDIFDPASIDAAVREIREYSAWVQRKTEELRRRVAQLICDSALPVFQSAIADGTFKVVVDGKTEPESPVIGGVTVSVEDRGNITVVIANGEDAVFMEFGAGVYYNGAVGSSPNPLGTGLGYTIGSYGKGNGAKRVWGFKGADGKVHLTHGVPASMPLYNAVKSVADDIERIAKEVFST